MSGMSPRGATPTPFRPTYEVVYERLRNQLITGEIVPGTRLYEVDLAERMAVSRTPVREALRRLESDGYAQRVRGGGLVVTPMGPDDLGDIGLLRIEIDGLAARLAAARASRRDWDHVSALVDEMAACQTDEQLARAHREVHRAVYALGFSPRMSSFFDNHLLPHIELTVNAGPKDRFDPEGAHRLHRALVRAMASGDVDRAVKAAQDHAARGARYARRGPGPGAR
jgi:DNA-binding GntR family transcriptional regulator